MLGEPVSDGTPNNSFHLLGFIADHSDPVEADGVGGVDRVLLLTHGVGSVVILRLPPLGLGELTAALPYMPKQLALVALHVVAFAGFDAALLRHPTEAALVLSSGGNLETLQYCLEIAQYYLIVSSLSAWL